MFLEIFKHVRKINEGYDPEQMALDYLGDLIDRMKKSYKITGKEAVKIIKSVLDKEDSKTD